MRLHATLIELVTVAWKIIYGFDRLRDIAYYYPAPYWREREGDWIKSLLLFFDEVAILLPDYMRGRHRVADPSLAAPLEDQGLLRILEPTEWIDGDMAKKLAAVIGDPPGRGYL